MKINGYTIETPFDPGAMAQAAKAKSPSFSSNINFRQSVHPGIKGTSLIRRKLKNGSKNP